MKTKHAPPNTGKVCDCGDYHYTCQDCGADCTMGKPAGPCFSDLDGYRRCSRCHRTSEEQKWKRRVEEEKALAGIKNPAEAMEAFRSLVKRVGRCYNDPLNPCWSDRPDDVAGKHWGGGPACAYCTALAVFGGAR